LLAEEDLVQRNRTILHTHERKWPQTNAIPSNTSKLITYAAAAAASSYVMSSSSAAAATKGATPLNFFEMITVSRSVQGEASRMMQEAQRLDFSVKLLQRFLRRIHTYTYRQTDRQTDRQTEPTGRQTANQTGKPGVC
jgi:hypothetical protein